MPALVHKLLAAVAPAAEPDADLLARFVAARDDDAFAELVRRHGPAVYHTCRRLVGPTSADDAFQATFLVLAARAGSVRKAASVGSWLVGVAGRVARRLRARGQRTEVRGQIDPDQLPARGSSPDLCLLSSDLCEVLTDEFTRLPDRLRAAAVACLVEGRTQEQAAAVLGWSSRTVRRRLDEAKGLLRTRLERRGVTPAAAVAAVAAAGEAVALPAGLARRAADGATLFLAGGGAHAPAAALAHGVLGTMRTLPVPAAVAACVVILAGLGLGWANDAAQADPDRIPAPKAAPPPPALKAMPTHTTANFVVEAPTAAVARALGDEFERQRKTTAIEWLGKELPAWKEPTTVRVEPHPAGDFYSGTVRFRGAKGAEFDAAIRGPLDQMLASAVPAHAARQVLVTDFGRPLPRWADCAVEGVAGTDQEYRVLRCLDYLLEGRALRLKTLFTTAGAKSDWGIYEAQGYAVAKFLFTRTPVKIVPVPPAGADGAIPTKTEPMNPRHTFTRFLRQSLDRGAEKAAYDVYGFDSLAQMETAWVEWMRRNMPPQPAPDAVAPDRIPPPDLRAPPPAPAGAATHRSNNFAVSAPSAEAAEKVAMAAERHRRELARLWLGKVLPDAAEPMPITVKITAGGAGGATTFTFGAADGKQPPGVKSAAMELHGPLDAILAATLPHEVMHVVLATHFGRPLPRWADEGIAVSAESEREQHNHEVRARELLNAGRGIRLVVLFRMSEYPRDVIMLFAQGHSVCRFLLARGGVAPKETGGGFDAGEPRAALLAFVARGARENTPESWAAAAKEVYGFDTLDALEQAWIDTLREPPDRPRE